MFWQFHHSIGDGLGLLLAFLPLMQVEAGSPLSKIPLPNALLPKELRKTSEGGGAGGGGGCCSCAAVPFKFCKGVAMPALSKPDTELRINPPLVKRTPFLKFNGNRVFTRFPNMPMSKLKIIKDAMKCSVNDVLMAALTGALRRYGADVRQDPLLSGDTKRKIEFKSLVMIALPRPLDPNNYVESLANKVLFASCPLPIGEPTPLGRLEETMANFNNLKSRPYVAGMAGLTDFVTSVAPNSVVRKLASETFSKHTLLVTNVPCTTCPLTVPKEGERMDEIHMVYPNIVTQVSIITYNGHVNANIVADPELFPEPEKLAKCWVEEFDALIKETAPPE